MIPPLYDEAELPARLRQLVASEIDRIVEDLANRRELLLEAWSRHRDRGPFVDTMFSRWTTIAMTDLALIDSDALTACEAFYRELDDFRMYCRYTEDMPTTMTARYDVALRTLDAYGRLAVERLGGVPDRPFVVIDDAIAPVEPGRIEVVDAVTEEE
ncbi:MAG: hypothetical protein AAF211_04335 [Myxococcota bacterium]